jgi:DNA segregation ATPase FtsK/SpoIIIE-like protein
MVCYGCGIDLHGYQAYRSLFCSQCLNRRAVEEQTRVQAQIAERQLELQQEQMREMEEQRELMEQRQYIQPVRNTKSAVRKPKAVRPYMVIKEEMENGGLLPDPYELGEACEILYKQAVQVVVETQQPLITVLKRHLGVDLNTAVELFEKMEKRGVLSAYDEQAGQRRVLV